MSQKKPFNFHYVDLPINWYEQYIKISLQNERINEVLIKDNCKVCGKAFSNKGELKRHMLSHLVETKVEIGFQCPKCGTEFVSKSNYFKHVKICTLKRQHIPNLPIENEVPTVLKKPKIDLTAPSTSRIECPNNKKSCKVKIRYRCRYCKHQFLNEGHLNRHMESHLSIIHDGLIVGWEVPSKNLIYWCGKCHNIYMSTIDIHKKGYCMGVEP